MYTINIQENYCETFTKGMQSEINVWKPEENMENVQKKQAWSQRYSDKIMSEDFKNSNEEEEDLNMRWDKDIERTKDKIENILKSHKTKSPRLDEITKLKLK